MSHEYETLQYNNASSLIRTHGIISIVFGALGLLGGLFVLLLASASARGYYDELEIAGIVVLALIIVFVILPHAYLVVSGIHLLREPRPETAKALIIINLVVGVFYNFVVLIFAIINLTQINVYERGYRKLKHHAHHS